MGYHWNTPPSFFSALPLPPGLHCWGDGEGIDKSKKWSRPCSSPAPGARSGSGTISLQGLSKH